MCEALKGKTCYFADMHPLAFSPYMLLYKQSVIWVIEHKWQLLYLYT